MAISLMKAIENISNQPKPKRFTPDDCPHCEYDRKFYGGGWVYYGNNGPISPCPLCNDDGKHPRKI